MGGVVRARRFWPVRKYPWGTCEALSSVHSDVGALKRLLFEEGFEELKEKTEQRYYSFRSQHLIGGDDPSLCAHYPSLASCRVTRDGSPNAAAKHLGSALWPPPVALLR